MLNVHFYFFGMHGHRESEILGFLRRFRTLLKMALIDLDFQGHLGSKRSKSVNNRLVGTITRRVFELGLPNLHQMCILSPFRSLFKMVFIDPEPHGHFGF